MEQPFVKSGEGETEDGDRREINREGGVTGPQSGRAIRLQLLLSTADDAWEVAPRCNLARSRAAAYGHHAASGWPLGPFKAHPVRSIRRRSDSRGIVRSA